MAEDPEPQKIPLIFFRTLAGIVKLSKNHPNISLKVGDNVISTASL